MSTLDDRLQNRSANNLDFLRFLAALLVIFSHCYGLLGLGRDPLDRYSNWEAFAALGLRIFFFMSGMLVTASWCHAPSVPTFLRKRTLRIFPGLVVAILFCTFVVGPLGTVLRPAQFFTRADTYRFLLNGFLPTISAYLPGAFYFNRYQAVNGSLWTLPYELACYLTVLLYAKLRLLTPRRFPLAIPVFLALVVGRKLLLGEGFLVDGHVRLGSLDICVIEFLLGVAAFLYRRWLPMNGWAAGLALAAYVGTLTVGWLGQYVALLAVPYCLLYFAQVPLPWLGRWARHGDLSYGMYIYAFPIQQLFIHTFGEEIGVVGLFGLSVALTAGIAYFSWQFVERPAIALRWDRWTRRERAVDSAGVPPAGRMPAGSAAS